MSYSRGTAYLLWALCFFGVSGIHRFYLGRIGTGVLWLCTWGLFGIGNVIDLFTIPSMVDAEGERRLPGPVPNRIAPAATAPAAAAGPAAIGAAPTGAADPIETVILRAARSHGGVVTPTQVAVGGEYGLDESKACLDDLVTRGHAELRVRTTGGMVYVFPDLLTPEAEGTVEPLT